MKNLLVVVDSFVFGEKYFFDLKSVVMEKSVGGEFNNIYYLFLPGMREHLMKTKNDYFFNRLIYNNLSTIIVKKNITNMHIIKYDYFNNSVARAILEEMMSNYIKVMQLVEVNINLLKISYNIMNPPANENIKNCRKYLFGIVDFDAFNKNPLNVFKKLETDYQSNSYFLAVLPSPSEFLRYENKFPKFIPDYSCWDRIVKIGINIDKTKVGIFDRLKYQLIHI